MPPNRPPWRGRQAAAIRKSKERRLLQTIERYDEDGHPSDKMVGAYYQIIPIPTTDFDTVVSFRVWVKGHAEREFDSLKEARKHIGELVNNAQATAKKGSRKASNSAPPSF